MAIESETDLRRLMFKTIDGQTVLVDETKCGFSVAIRSHTTTVYIGLEDYLAIADRIKVLLPFPSEG